MQVQLAERCAMLLRRLPATPGDVETAEASRPEHASPPIRTSRRPVATADWMISLLSMRLAEESLSAWPCS